MPSLSARQPLQTIVRPVSTALSVDENLERLCQEQQNLGERGGKGKEDSGEAICELLEDMMLQSVERKAERNNDK